MRESLRTRLLVWHLLTVASVITVFAASIAYFTWRTRLASVDAVLASRASLLARAVEPATDGRVDLVLGPEFRDNNTPGLYHALWAREGSLIDRSDAALPIQRPPGPGTWTHEGRRELALIAPSGVLILTGADLSSMRREVWALATMLMAIGTGILVVSAGGGWLVVGRALEPLDRINRTAQQMTGGDLGARIVVDAVDSEVSQVARALNSAFDRLHQALDRQRRFSADASHELRTPLTTLSTEIQWALGRPRSSEALRASLEVCGRAAARMQSVIERLLLLARGQAPPVHIADVSLENVARLAIEQVRVLAEAAGISIRLSVVPGSIRADADQILEAVTNVLTNAVRYNSEQGRVDVNLTAERDSLELSISDTGIGIRAEDLALVFEPFFRGDPARSRDTGGAGLGLAVAQSIVEQYGGVIRCESVYGRGTTVAMRFPVSADSSLNRAS